MLTHINKHGDAHMVDVSEKPITRRTAIAQGVVHMQPETLSRIISMGIPKGDVLATVRLAGIMGAKRTSELIPLCHPLNLKQVTVEAHPSSPSDLLITAEVVVVDTTGVEMEALTAVTVAALTVIDMCKAIDKSMVISDVHLVRKTGGRSGDFEWGEHNARKS